MGLAKLLGWVMLLCFQLETSSLDADIRGDLYTVLWALPGTYSGMVTHANIHPARGTVSWLVLW